MSTTIAISTLHRAACAWARDFYASADIEVRDLRPMPGNAGLSFGFEVMVPGSAAPRGLVLRLAPSGVRRSGNTDVLAQVPLLRGLHDRGLPVAPLVWSEDESSPFGTDAFIVELLPGRPLHLTDALGSVPFGKDGATPMVCQAVDVLARIHAVPWRELGMRASRPRPVLDEIAFWERVFERLPEQPPTAAALARELRRSTPSEPAEGLLHGDFQTNNVLYDDSVLTGVLDWELAGVGAQLLDLGWLAMMTDPRCWDARYAEMLRVVVDADQLRARYEQASGHSASDLSWFTALACFRFAVIVAFNTMLHRTGKRPDPFYEVLAQSIEPLLMRGRDLAAQRK